MYNEDFMIVFNKPKIYHSVINIIIMKSKSTIVNKTVETVELLLCDN